MACASGKRPGQALAVASNRPSFPAAISLAGAKSGRGRGGGLPTGRRNLPGPRFVPDRTGPIWGAASFDSLAGPDGFLAGRAGLQGADLADEYARGYGRRRA